MTREEAIKVIKSATVYTPEEMKALETLIPELRESEDERIRKEIICFIEYEEARGNIPDRWYQAKRPGVWIAYLEKQKEQKSRIDACGFPLRDEGESACSYLERCLAPDMRNIWYEVCSEIKEKRKEQKPWKVGANAYFTPEQKPAEWSEEDEIRLKEALEVLNESIKYLPFGYGYTKDVRLVTDWLKSLPEKLKSLRPSWKPSKEQIEALKAAMDRNDSIGYNLGQLYEQLKKL